MTAFTLSHVLHALTVDQLKQRLDLLELKSASARKQDLVDAIAGALREPNLHRLWELLNEGQRHAVAEALFAPQGKLPMSRYVARYGKSPEFTQALPEGKTQRYSYLAPPSLLAVFLFANVERGYQLPDELLVALRAWVPEPEPVRLPTVDAASSELDDLVVRACERAAIHDLAVVLRLARQGAIRVSATTGVAAAASVQALAGQLADGDFYSVDGEKRAAWEADAGAIKAYSWPLLLQAGGLATVQGGKLSLTPAGQAATVAVPAKVLAGLWRKWQATSKWDEFARVDIIKGQKSAGRAMTAVAPRRKIIAAVLAQCPVGTWVDVDEFARYLRATGQDFAVAHDPWKLYIGDRQYGALGYDGFYDWNILQLRYLLAYLFEVAAPLGVVDVAYLPPEGAREDFRSLWGTDDYAFLSRYDGLCHFRLTALGAYCLGLSADYAPPKATSSLRLSVSPSLTVKRTGGEPSAEDKLVLDTWFLALGDDAWSLDEAKAIVAVEQGLDPVALREFLSERDDQPLPERVDAFVQRAQRQGRALSVIGPALLIQCADAAIAERLATDKAAGKLCQRVGETQLAVRQEHEEKFRAAVRGMGVGLAG